MKSFTKRALSMLLVCVFLISMIPGVALAGSSTVTYYVANSASGGSDTTGTGAELTPFLTLGKAITQAESDGAMKLKLILLSDIDLSAQFNFSDYATGLSEIEIDGNSHTVQYTGAVNLGGDGGLLRVTDGLAVTFDDVTLSGSIGSYNARILYIADDAVVTLHDALVTKGRYNDGSATEGGAGALVCDTGALIVTGDTTFTNNHTTIGGGAVEVKDGGILSVQDNAAFTGNSAAKGGAIYVEANSTAYGAVSISGSTSITGNTATVAGGAVYIEEDGCASVQDAVVITGNTVSSSANNVYLAGPFNGSTFDISGATDTASIGITCENADYYYLVAGEDSYTIAPTTSGDEAGWSYDDGTYDIRYMVRSGVPGLYLCYKTVDMTFTDVQTLTGIEGKDINGETEDFLADAATLPSCTVSGAVLTTADTLLLGDGEDLVISISCDPDEYRIPTADIVEITSGGSDVPFTYAPNYTAGTATITIAAADKDALTAPLNFTVSAEKYYTLTVQMEGPLYTLSSDITGRSETVLDASVSKVGTEATATVKTLISGTDTPVAGVTVQLKDAVTSATAGASVTDADGKAYFTGLEAAKSYNPVLIYARTYRVIARDTVSLALSTLTGQTLADAIGSVSNVSVVSTYDASTGASTLTNINADTTVVYKIQSTTDTISFIGNEGAATTAPATITPMAKDMNASATTYGTLATATLTGYTFDGWYDAAEGGSQITDATAYSAGSSAKTLYAHWSANTTTAYDIQHWVEYAAGGVNVNYVAGTTQTKVEGGVTYYLYETTPYADGTSDAVKDITALSLAAMSDATYTWWTRSGFTADYESPCKVLADGSSAFSIYYNRNQYSISYDTASLSKGSAVAPVSPLSPTAVKFGALIGTLETPTLVGYAFDGWYDAAEGVSPSVKYVSSAAYNKADNLTLYAHWNANTDTKWKVIVVTQDLKTNADGSFEPGTHWTEYKTVTLDNSGTDFSAQTDTVKTLTIADVDALAITGFTYRGYSDVLVSDNPTYTANEVTSQITVLADGTGKAYLYYSRNFKTLDPKDPDGSGDDYIDGIITYGGTFKGQLPPDPTRAGYDFTGWVDISGNPITEDTSVNPYITDPNGIIIIKPTWSARQYTLTYIPGESCTFVPTAGHVAGYDPLVPGGYTDGSKVTYGQMVGVMPSAKKTGYTFNGWKLSGGAVVAPTTVVSIANVVIEDTTTPNAYEATRPLYAYYTPHTYHLHLNAGESPVTHTAGSATPDTVDVTFDAAISGLPIPTLEGYTFVTWYIMDSGTAINIKNGDVWTYPRTNGETVQVYAAYTPNQYKYTFNMNDSTGSTTGTLVNTAVAYATETFDAVYDGIFEVEASRPGYNFKGWSLTSTGAPLTATDLVGLAADTTVYAVWEPKQYDVKFVLNGSTLETGWSWPPLTADPATDSATFKVAFDTTVGTLPVNTKARAQFVGWKVNAPGWPATTIHETTITSLPQYTDYLDDTGIVLTAVLDYSIEFNPDGGTFVDTTGTAVRYEYQSALTTAGALPVVEKTGYKFDGWTTAADPTHIYTLSEIVNSDAAIDLIPSYSAKIRFMGNSGKIDNLDEKTYALSEITALPSATRSGYSLTGWFTEAENGTQVTYAGLKAANAPATVYAHWEAQPTGGGGGGLVQSITITTKSDAGAKVTPEGSTAVKSGDDLTVVTVVNEGYVVTEMLVDGKDITPVDEYEFKNITISHTFEVRTAKSHGIDWLTEKHGAYIYGYDDGLVHPDNNITRGQMAAIIYRLMKPEVQKQFSYAGTDFDDVQKTDWYYNEVNALRNSGIISGVGNNKFEPERFITRGEMVVIVSRFVQMNEADSYGFTDVSGHWAEKYINLAASMGWIKGFEDNTFRPELNITRAEAVAVMNRVMARNKLDLNSIKNITDMKTFADNADTSKWFYLDIQEAANAHYFFKTVETGYETWTSLIH